MNKLFLIVLIVFAVGIGGYFVMKRGSTYSPPQTTTAETTPAATGEVKNFSVSGNEFSFTPNTMSVSRGDTVTVVFTNAGKFPHNFVITELNVRSKTVSPGESDTVTFTADTAGTFTYFCSVPTHKDKGMAGILTVR